MNSGLSSESVGIPAQSAGTLRPGGASGARSGVAVTSDTAPGPPRSRARRRNVRVAPFSRPRTVCEVVAAPLPTMSVQAPQAPPSFLRWTWYFVMVRSDGSLQRSATTASPAAALKPEGFAGRAGSVVGNTVSTGESA